MSEPTGFKNRSISAKHTSNNKLNSNISIGHGRSLSRKVDRTYTEPNDYNVNFKNNKEGKTRMHTSFMDQVQRILPVNGIKQSQQLIQQNFLLKNELNTLNKRLYLQRGKIQNQKKKNQLYAKQLSRQFQKQVYYSNSQNKSYLIAGIKHQYQKIKQLYQQKCEQCNYLRSSSQATQLKELNLYCQSLQTQNKILIENISFLKKKSNINSYLGKTVINDEDLLIFKRKNQYLLKENQQLSYELSEEQKNFKQKDKKILFLQKLITEKQNNDYNSRKKSKQLQKQKKKLQFDLFNKNQQISSLKIDYQDQLQQKKLLHDKKFQIQRNIFQKSLKQKSDHIQKLEKQVAYLSTLLSYWKPLDELNRQNSRDFKGVQQQSISNDKFPLSRSRTPINPMLQDHQFYQQQNFLQMSQKNNNQNESHQSQGQIIKTRIIQNFEDNLQRVQKTSNKKWSEQAKKCRKVQSLQVQQIGQLLKCRLVGHNISVQTAKDYFSGVQQKKSKFDFQYISMNEVKQILMQFPFSLKQQQAFILSRYLIQDTLDEYVYCDYKNQLSRSIVKSILKAVIGQYCLPNKQNCQTKWKSIKKQYSYNLQLALKSICPRGMISSTKLIQLIKSLGIQTTEELQNFILGKLVIVATSLKQLKYQNLFDSGERIQ